jgi:hypothetical protein
MRFARCERLYFAATFASQFHIHALTERPDTFAAILASLVFAAS